MACSISNNNDLKQCNILILHTTDHYGSTLAEKYQKQRARRCVKWTTSQGWSGSSKYKEMNAIPCLDCSWRQWSIGCWWWNIAIFVRIDDPIIDSKYCIGKIYVDCTNAVGPSGCAGDMWHCTMHRSWEQIQIFRGNPNSNIN